jgi:hypothetical protein
VGKQIALFGVRAVRRDGIDLVRRVIPVDQSGSAASPSPRPHNDNVPDPGSPFALNAEKCRAQVEDQVVSFVAERPRNTGTVLHRLERDRLFSQGALLVRRQH